MKDITAAIEALDERYPYRYVDGFLIVENPEYQPDDGSNPNLVLDIKTMSRIMKALVEEQGKCPWCGGDDIRQKVKGEVKFHRCFTCRCAGPSETHSKNSWNNRTTPSQKILNEFLNKGEKK